MSKLDKRLVGYTYNAALAFGLVDRPHKMTFLSQEVADRVIEEVEKEIMAAEASKKCNKDCKFTISKVT